MIVDLRDSVDLTVHLLRNGTSWRQRLVEDFEFAGVHHVRAAHRYQIEISRELLREAIPEHPELKKMGVDGTVLARLPLGFRSKRPLLQFDTSGPGGSPAMLVPRPQVLKIESAWLTALRSAVVRAHPDHPVVESMKRVLTDERLALIAGSTRSLYNRYWTATRGLRLFRTVADRRALAEMVKVHLALPELPTLQESREILAAMASSTRVLSEIFEMPPHPKSTAERLVLALADGGPREPWTFEGLLDTLVSYGEMLESLAGLANTSDAAFDFLDALASFGRQWPVLLDVEIPVGRSATLWWSEDRPIRRRQGWFELYLAFGAASTYHLEARLSDPSTRMGRQWLVSYPGPGIWRTYMRALPFRRMKVPAYVDDYRASKESAALYVATKHRAAEGRPLAPNQALLRLQFKATRTARCAMWILLGLTSLAIAMVYFLPSELKRAPEREFAETLALLTIPLSLTAGALLTRDSSSLSSRVHAWLRIALGGASVTLFALAAGRIWAVAQSSTLRALILDKTPQWVKQPWVMDIVERVP